MFTKKYTFYPFISPLVLMLLPYALKGTISSLWKQGADVVTMISASSMNQREASIIGGKKKRRLLAAATIFIIVYSSYKLYKNKSRNQRRPGEVRLVSGTLACVGHLLELYHDPDTLINLGKREAGPAFRIKLATMDIYVLTGPFIQGMLHSPKRFNGYAGFQIIMPIERALKISYGHKFRPSPPNPHDKDPGNFY